MMDFVALAVLLLVIATTLALASRRPIAWALEEWHLMRADTWQGEQLINPRLGSMANPRVALVDLKRRALGKRMKQRGRSLISKRSAKNYVPVLTKAVEKPQSPPPMADKVVVPIRRVA